MQVARELNSDTYVVDRAYDVKCAPLPDANWFSISTRIIFPTMHPKVYVMSLDADQTSSIVKKAAGTVLCVAPLIIPQPCINTGYWSEDSRSVQHFRPLEWSIIRGHMFHMFLNHAPSTVVFLVIELRTSSLRSNILLRRYNTDEGQPVDSFAVSSRRIEIHRSDVCSIPDGLRSDSGCWLLPPDEHMEEAWMSRYDES